MLKNISVPVLVASLLAGSAVIAAGSAVARDTKSSVDAKVQATVDQPVALGNTDMSAAKKAAKKTKKTKKEM
jgi:predicted outer membrane protein